MVAMSSDGVETYELTTGSSNGDKFVDFVRGSLIPITQPFPDTHSIVIMDNCSVHHVQAVRTICHLGIGIMSVLLRVAFLPYMKNFLGLSTSKSHNCMV